MSKEDFLAWIRDFEESEKRAKKVYEAFSAKLTNELTELVFEHQPEMRARREEFQDGVNELSVKYMKEVKEIFEGVNFDFYRKIPPTKIRTVPKPKTKEDSEKYLKAALNTIPKEHHEEYAKLHWEDYKHEKRHENFLYAVFCKMKEVLAEYYFNYIVDFEGNYLRRLDYSIYLMCAREFLQAVYCLKGSD